MTRVAICAITYRRPHGLERLLAHVAELTFDQPSPEVEVVIIENEAAGPGRGVCEDWQENLPFPLHYETEPERGIPFARNKAIEVAKDAEWIAFIDDDEWPSRHWLAELLATQAQTGADIVSGPVVPQYEPDVPSWVVRGGFHQRKRWPSGSAIIPMSTNNVLIRRSLLAKFEPAFDTRLAMVGGSDSHFFQRAMREGSKAVWCDEALVEESVPASRTTAGWICRRAYRSGANFAFTQFDVQPRLKAARNVGWRVCKHLGWGIVGLPLTLWQGRAGVVSQLSHISRAGGILAGLCGHQHAEYQTIHGE